MASTYAVGTVSVSANATSLTGFGTSWSSAGILPGALLHAAGLSVPIPIRSVTGDTTITLEAASPVALSGAAYRIVNRLDGGEVSDLLSRLLQLLSRAFDLDGDDKSIALATDAGDLWYAFGTSVADRWRFGIAAGGFDTFRFQRYTGTAWVDVFTVNRTTGVTTWDGSPSVEAGYLASLVTAAEAAESGAVAAKSAAETAEGTATAEATAASGSATAAANSASAAATSATNAAASATAAATSATNAATSASAAATSATAAASSATEASTSSSAAAASATAAAGSATTATTKAAEAASSVSSLSSTISALVAGGVTASPWWLDGFDPSAILSIPKGAARLSGAVSTDAALAATSSGSKLAIGPTGTLDTVSANALAYDWSTGRRRLRVEPRATTNHIVSNNGTGAAAGTPGTLPTGWSYFATSGLSTQVVGKGTALGIPYVDLRLFGTATNTYVVLSMGSKSGVAAGDQLCTSAWLSLVGGSTSGIVATYVETRWPTGVNTDGAVTLSSTPTRGYAAGTNGATSGTAVSALYLALTNGSAIDITIRIGLPQLEAGLYPSSPIVTSGATANRITDDARPSTALAALMTATWSSFVIRGRAIWGSGSRVVIGGASAYVAYDPATGIATLSDGTHTLTCTGTAGADFGIAVAVSPAGRTLAVQGCAAATTDAYGLFTAAEALRFGAIVAGTGSVGNLLIDEVAPWALVGSSAGIKGQGRVYA